MMKKSNEERFNLWLLKNRHKIIKKWFKSTTKPQGNNDDFIDEFYKKINDRVAKYYDIDLLPSDVLMVIPEFSNCHLECKYVAQMNFLLKIMKGKLDKEIYIHLINQAEKNIEELREDTVVHQNHLFGTLSQYHLEVAEHFINKVKPIRDKKILEETLTKKEVRIKKNKI